MSTAWFALHGGKYLEGNLRPRIDPEDALEAAVTRLRRITPRVERFQNAVLVRETDVDSVAARARELEVAASAAPYVIAGEAIFLPLAAAGVIQEPDLDDDDARDRAIQAVDDARRVWGAIVWNGDVASSRLVQFHAEARIGGGDPEIPCSITDDAVARMFVGGHHIYVERTTDDEDVVTLFDGQPLTRARRFHRPNLLFVTRRSAPEITRIVVVIAQATDAIEFARNRWVETHGEAGDPWARTALEAAALRGNAFSLAFVWSPDPTWHRLVATLPAGFRRTIGFYDSVDGLDEPLAIAAEGTRDELAVHGDQLREHLRAEGLVIADAISLPHESAGELYARVKALFDSARANQAKAALT